MQDCIFCKIINKEIPSEILYEDEKFIVFNDIKPFGLIALLVVPKEHYSTILDLEGHDELLSGLMNVGLGLVRNYKLDKTGFSFHLNGGGVQEIDHLHLKIGGGWKNKWDEGYPKW